MKIIVAEDYEDLSRRAANWLRNTLTGLANPNVVLATGNTPVGLYRNLGADPDRQFLANARIIELDEYQGIHLDDPRLLAGWLRNAFLRPLSIPETAFLSFPSILRLPIRIEKPRGWRQLSHRRGSMFASLAWDQTDILALTSLART